MTFFLSFLNVLCRKVLWMFDLCFLATIKTIKYLASASGVISIAVKEANFCTRTRTIMRSRGIWAFIREKATDIRCILGIICVEYLKEFELIEVGPCVSPSVESIHKISWGDDLKRHMKNINSFRLPEVFLSVLMVGIISFDLKPS